MKRSALVALLALAVISVFSMTAPAQDKTRSVWTNSNGYYIFDPTGPCTYTAFSGFNMATSWNQDAPAPNPAEAHFRGVAKAAGTPFSPCPTRFYDFRLVASSNTTDDQIDGTWNVFRNGILVCAACNGTAYGLSQAAGVGNYYKVYVDDPFWGPQTWGYIGFLDQRKDF